MYYLDEDGNVVSDYEKETDSGSVKNLNPEAFYYIIHLFENADWKDGVEDNAADFVIGGLQDKNVLYYISILDGYRTMEGEVVLLYNEMDYSDDGSYLFKKGQYIVTLRPAEEGAGVEYWIVSNLPYEK